MICNGYWFLSRLSITDPLTTMLASFYLYAVLESDFAAATPPFFDALEYCGEYPIFCLDKVLALSF